MIWRTSLKDKGEASDTGYWEGMITDREGKLLSKKPRKGRISRRKPWSTPSNTPELWQGKNDKCPLVTRSHQGPWWKVQGMKKNDTTAEWIADKNKFYLLCLFKMIEQTENVKVHLGRRLQDEQVEERAQLMAQSPWGSQRKRNLDLCSKRDSWTEYCHQLSEIQNSDPTSDLLTESNSAF